MTELYLKDVILDGQIRQISIDNGKFTCIGDTAPENAVKTIDGKGKLAILPPFYNMHTHLAMSLLRSYADDKKLFDWLQNYIWPLEAKLTAEDVYAGCRLAMLELIKTGCVFFNDSYWFPGETVRAAESMGMRGAVGLMVMSSLEGEAAAKITALNEEVLAMRGKLSPRLEINYSPHAIYTVNEKRLLQVAEESRRNNLRVHIHLSETSQELEDCRKAHGGLAPAEYLDRLGLLNDSLIAAHCVHLTPSEIELAAEKQIIISHQPVSNMKLASGLFPFDEALKAGCRVTIGTDGNASNNCLSLFDEMKFAAISAKVRSWDPTHGNAADVWRAATFNAAQAALRRPDCGRIAVGFVADAQLIDVDNPALVPNHNLISDLVYSASSEVVDTVICDGRVLMEHRVVPGETEIIQTARQVAARLAKSCRA